MNSCLSYCPTSSTPSQEASTWQCGSIAGDDPILDMNFSDLPGCEIACYFSQTSPYSVTVQTGDNDDACDTKSPKPAKQRGLYFDGSDDYLRIQGIILNSSFSLIMWLNMVGNTKNIASFKSAVPDGTDSLDLFCTATTITYALGAEFEGIWDTP